MFISSINLSGEKLSEAEKKAEDAYRKYVNGSATFAQLVSEYSEDEKTRYKNGDSGYLSRDDQNAAAYFGEKFFNAVFDTPDGEVKGVVRSNLGFHIIRIDEKIDARLLGLDDPVHPATKNTVRDYIANIYLQNAQKQAMNAGLQSLVNELKKEAEINIFEDNIN